MNEGSPNLAMLSFSSATAFQTPQKTSTSQSVMSPEKTPQQACKASTPQSVMAPNPITWYDGTVPNAHHFYQPPDPIQFDGEVPFPVSAGFFSALKKKLFSWFAISEIVSS